MAAGLAGCESQSVPPDHSTETAEIPTIPAMGRYQAGITIPQSAQSNLLALVADVDAAAPIGPLLAELGQTIHSLTEGTDPRLLGFAPGDLTVTIGVGPRLVRTVDPSLPGAIDLPQFSREHIDPLARGGDLLIQVCASDPLVLPVVAAALGQQAGDRIHERWRQSGHRGSTVPIGQNLTAARNLLGFVDGIVGPRTTVEQEHNLWLAAPNPVAGATIAVLRRMELDLSRFDALSVVDQEAVLGRHRATGTPLSGGTIASSPDLGGKTPDGRYLIPIDAHVRRANASALGVGLMLRRSYSTDEPTPGLLFISFQNDIQTFINTLAHMDNSDALLSFTTTTASATFLIVPGFDEQHPLGATLFH